MAIAISTVKNIYKIYKSIKESAEQVEINQKSFTFLSNRCEAILEPLDKIQKNSPQFEGYEKSIDNLHECFIEINLFMAQTRFKKKPSLLNQINELMNAKSDAEKLKSLHDKLNIVLIDFQAAKSISNGDLNQILTKEINDRVTMCLEILGVPNANDSQAVEGLLATSHKKAQTLGRIVEDASGNNEETKMDDRCVVQAVLLPLNPRKFDWNSKNPIIGKGQFAVVYSGRYNNEPVAVKYFPEVNRENFSSTKNTQLYRLIKREALILQNVSHPNILKFIAASLESGILLFELAACCLNDVLYNGHPITKSNVKLDPAINSLKWKQAIIYDIAKAIRYLHANNILHRDIKPANILLFVSGSMTVAKVGDFGLSKAVDLAVSSVGNSKGGAVGSIRYMAPELLTHPPTYSSSSDVYAFGVLITELMSGKIPWEGMELVQISLQVNSGARTSKDDWIPSNTDSILFDLVGSSTEGMFASDPIMRPSFVDICEVSKRINQEKDRIVPTVDFELLKQQVTSPSDIDIFSDDSQDLSPRDLKLKDELKQWIVSYVPDIPLAKVDSYTYELFVSCKLTTPDRIRKVVPGKGPEWLESHNFDPQDAEDLIEACKLTSRPELCSQGPEALKIWLQTHIKNMPNEVAAKYVELLLNNNIYTPSRLLKNAKVNPNFLQSIGFEEFDARDILTACTGNHLISLPDNKRLDPIPSNLLFQKWLEIHTPGIISQDVIRYSSIIVSKNVHSVERLHEILKEDPNWLVGILNNQIDAEEISEAVMTYFANLARDVEWKEQRLNARELWQRCTVFNLNSIKDTLLLPGGSDFVLLSHQDDYGWTAEHYFCIAK